MIIGIGRRQFISAFGGAAATWSLAARAQQQAMPVVAFINAGSPDGFARYAAAYRKGLNETGYVEGQNVAVEYHWLEGQYYRLPALVADLVRRQVAVIATPANAMAARAAEAATATIPPSLVSLNSVQLGLVASLARPGGNATGINLLTTEVTAKRLRLLHDLVPKAVRIAVLVNPANPGGQRAHIDGNYRKPPYHADKFQLPDPQCHDHEASSQCCPRHLRGRAPRCALRRCRLILQ